jgi:GNAT superfamily N-acetyltransferase
MPETVQLRPATGRDAADVARLSAQLGYPVTPTAILGRLEQFAASPLHMAVVAELGGAVVGWAAAEQRLVLESEPRAEITGLVVDATLRRRGVGRLLVAEMQRWASTRGCREVLVRSNVLRTESHPFYERLGFERAKTQHSYRRALDEG